jgi:hypothetical protein
MIGTALLTQRRRGAEEDAEKTRTTSNPVFSLFFSASSSASLRRCVNKTVALISTPQKGVTVAL